MVIQQMMYRIHKSNKCLFVSNMSVVTPTQGGGYCYLTLVLTAQWFKLFDRTAELQHFTFFLKGNAKSRESAIGILFAICQSMPRALQVWLLKVCLDAGLMYLQGIIVMLAGRDLHASNPKLTFSGCRAMT